MVNKNVYFFSSSHKLVLHVDLDIPPLEDIPVSTSSTAQAAPAPPVVKHVQPPPSTTTAKPTGPSASTKVSMALTFLFLFVETKEKETDKGFAGMRKGFLNSSGTAPKPKPKTEEMVEIKRKPAEEPSFFRIIKEPDRKKKEEDEEEERKKGTVDQ